MATENKLQLNADQIAEIAALIMQTTAKDESKVEELKEAPKAVVAEVTKVNEEKVTNKDLTAILTTLGGMLMSTASKSAGKINLSDGIGLDDMVGFLSSVTKTSTATTANDPLSAVVGGLLGNSPEVKSGQGSSAISDFAGTALTEIFKAATKTRSANASNDGFDFMSLAGTVISAALKG